MPSRYAELAASEAGSSRGDEEETLLEVEEAKHSVPWYKDFQVAAHYLLVIPAAPQGHLRRRLTDVHNWLKLQGSANAQCTHIEKTSA